MRLLLLFEGVDEHGNWREIFGLSFLRFVLLVLEFPWYYMEFIHPLLMMVRIAILRIKVELDIERQLSERTPVYIYEVDHQSVASQQNEVGIVVELFAPQISEVKVAFIPSARNSLNLEKRGMAGGWHGKQPLNPV